MIPIFHVEGNKLTSLKGEVSSFFEILPPDLEGVDEKANEKVFLDLERSLINTEGLLKFYWLGKRLYLNSFCEVVLSHAKVMVKERPVATFLEADVSEIHFYENYLTCGNSYLRLLSMKSPPGGIHLNEVLSWPDFVLMMRKIPKLEAKKKVNMKRKLHFSALFKEMRDLDSENAYGQAETIFDDVTTDQKALFEVETFLILKSSSKEELDRLTDKTLYEFKGKDAALFVEERGLSYFYQCLIPGVMASFKRKIEAPSDYLTYLVPFHHDFVMHTGLKLKARSNNSVLFDLFNPQAMNYNVLITGSSGQGKSMLANYLLKFELSRGCSGVVLDLGSSFVKNAKFHGGVVLSERFNPLQFNNPRYLKEFILAAMSEKLSRKEEGLLVERIEMALNDKEVSTFLILLEHLEADFPGMRFYFHELMPFFCDEKLVLHDFTYCDFGQYPEAMKAPLIIYLIEYFKNLKGKKIFIFDECWHLLTKNADYIAECFRTFRKHQASAVAISQNLDDFSESQLGRVIIQNTYFKFLFKQSLRESEFLDQHAKNLLDTIISKKGEYSEFLLMTDTIKKPLRYYPSALEYEIFTSDREDARAFERYMEKSGQFLGFKEALINFTKIKNPRWNHDE